MKKVHQTQFGKGTTRWNPNKELMIRIFDKTLSLFRFTLESWSKVWSFIATESITDLFFKPDGNSIAISSCSLISIISTETGLILHSFSVSNPSCLYWSQSSLDSTEIASKLSLFPPSKSNVVKPTQETLNLLLVGTESGQLIVSLFGIFILGTIKLNDKISSVCSSPLLDKLFISTRDALGNFTIHEYHLDNLLANKKKLIDLSATSIDLNVELTFMEHEIKKALLEFNTLNISTKRFTQLFVSQIGFVI